MATITASAVYVQDARLTDLSLFLGNDLEGDFAQDWIAPEKAVTKDIGQYNKWGRDHQRSIENDIRPDGAEGAVVTFGFSQASYVAHEYAFQTWLPASVLRLEDPGLDLDTSIPLMLAEMEKIRKETRLVDAIDDTSYHDSGDNAVTLSGTNQWSDYTNSDPVADIEAGRQKIRRKIGKFPNKAWMSPEVFSKLQYHPRIVQKLGGALNEKFATVQDLQQIFQIPEIRVIGGQKNTAAYGATDAYADIWGYDFYMTYSVDNPGLMSMTTGLHFARTLDMAPGQRAVSETRFDNLKGIYWWRRMYTGTYNDVGGADGTSYLIKSAVATPA